MIPWPIANSPALAPGRRGRVAWRGVASGLLLLLAAPRVHAEASTEERTLAEALFREGRQLLEQGDVARACIKLGESQRLEPAGGTLLNLAVCHEREGKLATAWTEFREARAQARAEGRADRVELAEQRLGALEPRLPKLEVSVADDARGSEELVLELDGVTLGRAAWGSALPVDPGAHVVSASAPGHRPWRTRIEVGEGELARVPIPELELVRERETAATKDDASRGATASGGGRTLGYVIGGVGLAALAVGGYFGITALDQNEKSEDECPTSTTCSERGEQYGEDASRSAWIANVGIGLGLVGVGVGTYLVLRVDAGDSGGGEVANGLAWPRAATATFRGSW